MTGSHRFPLKKHKGEWCNTFASTWKSSVWISTTSEMALPNPPKVEFYILHPFSEYQDPPTFNVLSRSSSQKQMQLKSRRRSSHVFESRGRSQPPRMKPSDVPQATKPTWMPKALYSSVRLVSLAACNRRYSSAFECTCVTNNPGWVRYTCWQESSRCFCFVVLDFW